MLSNKVGEIMTGDIVTAPASSTIFAVMEMMAEKKVGRVVIIENQLPAGIFTEQDILKRVMNRKLDPKKIAIKQVMTSPIRAVSSDTRIVEALGKMYQGKFRHLLVTGEKKTMVGLVSMRRILKIAVELGRGLPETQAIGSIMSPKVTTVDASQSIYETIGTMVKEKTGCVIVLTNGEPSGIFTERDILKRVAIKDIDTQKTPIREVITAPLVTLAHSALVGEALAEMYRRGFRHLLIRGDREKLAGIVSMWDVLKYARALDIDESVRRTWKEIKEYWDSEQHYTPG